MRPLSPLISDGEMVGSVLEFRDISDQKRNERDLEDSVQSLKTLSSVGQHLTAVLNLDRLVQSVTDAATQLSRARFGAFFYTVVNEL